MKKNDSGKKRFIKGTVLYLWEELKTMNQAKIHALKAIITGYLKMKKNQKRITSNKSNYPSGGR